MSHKQHPMSVSDLFASLERSRSVHMDSTFSDMQSGLSGHLTRGRLQSLISVNKLAANKQHHQPPENAPVQENPNKRGLSALTSALLDFSSYERHELVVESTGGSTRNKENMLSGSLSGGVSAAEVQVAKLSIANAASDVALRKPSSSDGPPVFCSTPGPGKNSMFANRPIHLRRISSLENLPATPIPYPLPVPPSECDQSGNRTPSVYCTLGSRGPESLGNANPLSLRPEVPSVRISVRESAKSPTGNSTPRPSMRPSTLSLGGKRSDAFIKRMTRQFRVDNMILNQSYWALYEAGDSRATLMKLGQQEDYAKFSHVFTQYRRRQGVVKIGEGCFGEVFRCLEATVAPISSPPPSSSDKCGESNRITPLVAVKLIPIEGTVLFNGDPQKTFGEVLSEVIVAKELTALNMGRHHRTEGFAQLKNVRLVRGAFPSYLTKAWEKYHRERKSENDHPRIFPNSQLWLVIESEFGGSALEDKLPSCASARLSILRQITLALAVAEAELHFEHRDLHWGNVLIRKHQASEELSNRSGKTDCAQRTPSDPIRFRLEDKELTVPSHGYTAVVIDFTLSRLEQDGGLVYVNLSADPALFESQGDYQFDVYRFMRKETKDRWNRFCPRTNVLWLHYLAAKLSPITDGDGGDTRSPCSCSCDAQGLEDSPQVVLQKLEHDLRHKTFASAGSLVQKHPAFAVCRIDRGAAKAFP